MRVGIFEVHVGEVLQLVDLGGNEVDFLSEGGSAFSEAVFNVFSLTHNLTKWELTKWELTKWELTKSELTKWEQILKTAWHN